MGQRGPNPGSDGRPKYLGMIPVFPQLPLAAGIQMYMNRYIPIRP